MPETWVRSLVWEDALEKKMGTHPSILAWRTPWTVACQTPLFMEFSRQEDWSGLPFLLQGIFPNQGLNLVSCIAGRCFTVWATQFSSIAQSWTTLCDPMHRCTPGLPVHHHLPEFTQTNVHRVGDAIQPSHPLSSPFPLQHISVY